MCGSPLVQGCVEQEARAQVEEHGYQMEEAQSLETPVSLGIDECARRKGHGSDALLADVQAKRVLAVGSGSTLEDVQILLEHLKEPEKVKAVCMDRSAVPRPAAQRCLPKAWSMVDHVHLIQHVMKGFRNVLASWAHTTERKTLLEGKQHLFLRAKEDFTQKEEQERRKMEEHLPQLRQAWQRKEA